MLGTFPYDAEQVLCKEKRETINFVNSIATLIATVILV